MKKWIVGLGSLLALQLALAAVMNIGGDQYDAFKPEQKLADFETALIDSIKLADGDSELILARQQGQWQLPALENFPADQAQVEQLLKKLAGLKKGWPVATTGGAAQRFKVDEEAFERRITLSQGGDEVARLYFGTSPGFRKVHARASGEDQIVAVEFSLFEANTRRDDWIDKAQLKLDADEIVRAELAGLTLQRQDGVWQVADLKPDEQMVADKAATLTDKLATLRIESVLADDAEATEGEPLMVTLSLAGGKSLEYRFSKLKAGGYRLQRSDQTVRFKIAEQQVTPIKEALRANLVEAKPAAVETDAEQPQEDGDTSPIEQRGESQ